MTARGIDFTGIAYLVVLAAAGYAVYRVAKGAPTVAEAVQRVTDAAITAVNPADPNNLANRAANAITARLTDDPSMTPGLWLENQLKRLFTGSGKSTEGDKLLADFAGAWEQDDADIGRAGLTLMRRGEPIGWTAADQDDADLGFAMSANAGAAFIDYSRLRRGVFH